MNFIINNLIKELNPYKNTYEYISNDIDNFNDGRVIVISIGKASYDMAKASYDLLKDKIYKGVVISKYNHIKGNIDRFKMFEAGHPIVDENSIIASNYVLDVTSNLNRNDKVILLLSGGGSALFEKPLIELSELQDINNQLLRSGANINEINIIRKRLSAVKGGKFAKHINCEIYAYILSDVLGNDLSSIASGPVSVDNTNSIDALNIVNKYKLNVSNRVLELLNNESIKDIDNVYTKIIGSNDLLCEATKKYCEELGYDTKIIQKDYSGLAKDLGIELANTAINNQDSKTSKAFIYGGEALVKVTGNGLGGRNSEMALYACKGLSKCHNSCVFCFGSDGTDGPTDASGGYVDEYTLSKLDDVDYYLNNNDSYNGLKKTDGLIITGPTGNNVNDVYVLLIKR